MKKDPASLENLRDIIEPPPVSWWPLAPGWWLLMGLVTGTVAALIFRQWRTWRANSYRRAALAELTDATTVQQVNEILKRTALAVWPRQQVASLTGAAWRDWLSSTSEMRLSDQVSEALSSGVFRSESTAELNAVKEFAADWIRRHRVPAENPTRKLANEQDSPKLTTQHAPSAHD